ncbi:hydroxymethylglutaryl-CoA reductase, degradative [Lactobacillus sp. DCY120]|uniref:3-hydroxy-3-methylglutaryl coenzyme A reductase n=1 Tax=Bombilactobacillus apium TaxID=2675299 RepID=A0A850R7D7_9LACO|nr:hydroxymethylglutaryl-CoA reductase, degradative [Bombilactobacillus apium]NVY96757.1 hydroxymethylglutaryl-CoA reductase, degradative [Bombilactobacillus apium]
MTKFYELTTAQRLDYLQEKGYLTVADRQLLQSSPALPEEIASHLVENQIGSFPLPLGLANHFLIDGQAYLVPLATEEPSVIAAASNAAGRISRSGGFHTQVQREGIIGQIVFKGELAQAEEFLQTQESLLYQVARQAHPSLWEHGGGVRQITVQNLPQFVEFQLLIDPGEAMGANVVNTIVEAVAQVLKRQLPDLEFLLAILSNSAPQMLAQAQVQVKLEELQTATMTGLEVAQRIAAASQLAQVSPVRAATHNKGIMNGIEALVLATGNDTRSVSAAIYAGLDQGGALSTWKLTDQGLQGKISLHLPLGSLGGAISTLPVAQLVRKILQKPTAQQLMGIVAAVGLASNLAALRALVTQGIQAGHMNLQFQSLAMMAGAKATEIDAVVAKLRQEPKQANLARTQEILSKLRQESEEI